MRRLPYTPVIVIAMAICIGILAYALAIDAAATLLGIAIGIVLLFVIAPPFVRWYTRRLESDLHRER